MCWSMPSAETYGIVIINDSCDIYIPAHQCEVPTIAWLWMVALCTRRLFMALIKVTVIIISVFSSVFPYSQLAQIDLPVLTRRRTSINRAGHNFLTHGHLFKRDSPLQIYSTRCWTRTVRRRMPSVLIILLSHACETCSTRSPRVASLILSDVREMGLTPNVIVEFYIISFLKSVPFLYTVLKQLPSCQILPTTFSILTYSGD